MFIEHPQLYLTKGEVPEGEYTLPFGVADVKREGRDATIITYSRGVLLAQQAAERLKEEGIEVEIIDLRTLVPCDWETVFRSIRKTHRAIAVHDDIGATPGLRRGDCGAEFRNTLLIIWMHRSLRVAGADVPMPYNNSIWSAASCARRWKISSRRSSRFFEEVGRCIRFIYRLAKMGDAMEEGTLAPLAQARGRCGQERAEADRRNCHR